MPLSRLPLPRLTVTGLPRISLDKSSRHKKTCKCMKSTLNVFSISAITVNWEGYFRNQMHTDGHFLNEIEKFHSQFVDLENLGIRNTEK